MKTRIFLSVLLAVTVWGLVAAPVCPAALVWHKGEGWTYERGGVTTLAANPTEQLALARSFEAKKEWSNALDCYRRLLSRWPTASAAQDAQFGMAECLANLGYHYRAFKEYQMLLTRFPNTKLFDAVLQRQFEIGNLFLAGERDKAWGIRWFKAPEKAVEIFEQVVKNGPFAPIAPEAQYRIGVTQEKLKEYALGIKAYEKVIERYPKHALAETAAFAIGMAYHHEARRAEYDQAAADQAMTAFADYLVRYPQSDRAELIRQDLAAMEREQARGLFKIGQFYEKNLQFKAALIYYNEVIARGGKTEWASMARGKVETLGHQLAKPAPVKS
jgi:outer membrane protein assembly factor BamD